MIQSLCIDTATEHLFNLQKLLKKMFSKDFNIDIKCITSDHDCYLIVKYKSSILNKDNFAELQLIVENYTSVNNLYYDKVFISECMTYKIGAFK